MFESSWNPQLKPPQDTGLYKALVKSQDIEEELTKIRNLIRKRCLAPRPSAKISRSHGTGICGTWECGRVSKWRLPMVVEQWWTHGIVMIISMPNLEMTICFWNDTLSDRGFMNPGRTLRGSKGLGRASSVRSRCVEDSTTLTLCSSPMTQIYWWFQPFEKNISLIIPGTIKQRLTI